MRKQLLDFGAKYVWLDVLCLRQSSNPCPKKHCPQECELCLHQLSYFDWLKKLEWEIDVPTIGNVYRSAKKIVRYFNGLGVPFSLEDWDGDKHWLRRAWTLQEITDEDATIDGSPYDGDVLKCRGKFSGKPTTLEDAINGVVKISQQIQSKDGCGVYELVKEMASRVSTNPIDKISGLLYLLNTVKLPCYHENFSCEDYWTWCFYLLPTWRKVEILFDFPERGSETQWFPTWEQNQKWPARGSAHQYMGSPDLRYSTDSGNISFTIMDLAIIHRVLLSQIGNSNKYVARISGEEYEFFYPYELFNPSSDSYPTIAGGKRTFTFATLSGENWIACERLLSEKVGVVTLKKVMVLCIDDITQRCLNKIKKETADCVFKWAYFSCFHILRFLFFFFFLLSCRLLFPPVSPCSLPLSVLSFLYILFSCNWWGGSASGQPILGNFPHQVPAARILYLCSIKLTSRMGNSSDA